MAYKYSTLPLPLSVKHRLKDLWQRYGTWKYLGIFFLTKVIWTAVLFAIYHYLPHSSPDAETIVNTTFTNSVAPVERAQPQL